LYHITGLNTRYIDRYIIANMGRRTYGTSY